MNFIEARDSVQSSIIVPSDSYYVDEAGHYYPVFAPQIVEENIGGSGVAALSPPVLADLTNSANLTPNHQWSTVVPFGSVEPNHQQIQELPIQCLKEISENVPSFVTQGGIKNGVTERVMTENDAKSTLVKNKEEGRRKLPKKSEMANYYQEFKQLQNLQMKRGIANERERKRTQSLKDAFESLRQTIPTSQKKLSKIQTVQLAARYIEFLCNALTNRDDWAGEGSSGSNGYGKLTEEKLKYAFSVWRVDNWAHKPK